MRSQLTRPAAKTGRATTGRQGPPSDIPDKLYFRIGEVARLCAVPTYVLRFWETEFPQLKPTKGGTGQRLYRRRDVEMALKIRKLLYDEGYTIPGARQAFAVEGRQIRKGQKQSELPLENTTVTPSPIKVKRLRNELREILGMLSAPVGRPRLITRMPTNINTPQLFKD